MQRSLPIFLSMVAASLLLQFAYQVATVGLVPPKPETLSARQIAEQVGVYLPLPAAPRRPPSHPAPAAQPVRLAPARLAPAPPERLPPPAKPAPAQAAIKTPVAEVKPKRHPHADKLRPERAPTPLASADVSEPAAKPAPPPAAQAQTPPPSSDNLPPF